MAIAGVGSFAGSLTDGLAREGRVILGGDLAFSLIQREASDAERAFLAARGTVSVAATLRAMARTARCGRTERAGRGQGGRCRLSAVRHGRARSGDAARRRAGAREGDVFGAAVDPTLLARLDLKPGDRITIGAATIELRAALKTEPDKLAGGIGFGPRVLMSEAALRATGLIQPGSLVRWHYRLRLAGQRRRRQRRGGRGRTGEGATAGRRLGNPHPHQRLAAARAQRRALHPIPDAGRPHRAAGRRRRRRQRGEEPSRPQARRHRHPEGARRDRRRRVRDLSGADPARGARSLRSSALALGAALPFCIVWAFGAIIPLPIAPALHPGALALSIVYGLLTALAFALWPLGARPRRVGRRRCSATWSPASGAGRAGATSWRPR